MKLIIAGSRSIRIPTKEVNEYVRNWERAFGRLVTSVMTGGAEGVDACGSAWARERFIPVRVYHADWKRYGRAAGPLRNRQMAKVADGLLLVWDGRSKGSESMLKFARDFDLLIYEVRCE